MRRRIRRITKFQIFLCSLLLLIICGASIAVYVFPKLSFDIQQDSYHMLWNEKGISNYQIEIVTEALPAPPVDWLLTIQNGRITQQSLVGCEHPVDQNIDCNIIYQYYSWIGKYTVAQLFDLADTGLRQTQNSLVKCNLLTANNFRAFSTLNAAISAAQTCQNYLQSLDTLYAVRYDPDYGYTKFIASYVFGVMDGSTTIDVKNFRLIQ